MDRKDMGRWSDALSSLEKETQEEGGGEREKGTEGTEKGGRERERERELHRFQPRRADAMEELQSIRVYGNEGTMDTAWRQGSK